MQLLFAESDESEGTGIGLLPGRVEVLDAPIVPQMGWNDVEISADRIFQGLESVVAYYANSYICAPSDPSHVIAWSEYGQRRYAAAVRSQNTWGLQFHPEKSSDPGRRIISNFLEVVREAT
jgi:glutamine amidotransferase